MTERSSSRAFEPRNYLSAEEVSAHSALHPSTLWPKLAALTDQMDGRYPLTVQKGTEPQLLVAGAGAVLDQLFASEVALPRGVGASVVHTLLSIDYLHGTPSVSHLPEKALQTKCLPELGNRPTVTAANVEHFGNAIIAERKGMRIASAIAKLYETDIPFGWTMGDRSFATGGIALQRESGGYLGGASGLHNYRLDGITIDRLKTGYEIHPPKGVQSRYIIGRYIKSLAVAGHTFEEPAGFTAPPILLEPFTPQDGKTPTGEPLPNVGGANFGLASDVQRAAWLGLAYPATKLFVDPEHPGAGVMPERVSELLDDIFRKKTLSAAQSGMSDLQLKMLCAFDATHQPINRELARYLTPKLAEADIALAELLTLSTELGVPCNISNVFGALANTDRIMRHSPKKKYEHLQMGFFYDHFEMVLMQRELTPQDAYVLTRYYQTSRSAAETVERALKDL